MDYLVLPPEATGWRMEPVDFEAALVAAWPDAELRASGDGVYAIDFALAGPPRVDGAFGRNGQVLALEGDIAAVVRVAVWFRGLVPPGQLLLFCDPALNGQVELAPGADPDALARAYLDDAG